MAHKDSKNLQAEVIKRFMNDARYEEFIREYNSSRKNSAGSKDRSESLNELITDDQMTMLKTYIDETDTPVTALSNQFNLTHSRFYSTVYRTALKFLYQNRAKLD